MTDKLIGCIGHDCAVGQHQRNEFNPARQIAIVWSIEDVQQSARELGYAQELTDEECMDVLDAVKDKHDASLGVSWTTIEFWVGELIPKVTWLPTPEQVTELKARAVAMLEETNDADAWEQFFTSDGVEWVLTSTIMRCTAQAQ